MSPAFFRAIFLNLADQIFLSAFPQKDGKRFERRFDLIALSALIGLSVSGMYPGSAGGKIYLAASRLFMADGSD